MNYIVEFPMRGDSDELRTAKIWYIDEHEGTVRLCIDNPQDLLDEIALLKKENAELKAREPKPVDPLLEDMRKLFEHYKTSESVSGELVQLCGCYAFQQRFGITIDDQDLREWGATKCPYCGKPFEKKI